MWIEIQGQLYNCDKFENIYLSDDKKNIHVVGENHWTFKFDNVEESEKKYQEIKNILLNNLENTIEITEKNGAVLLKNKIEVIVNKEVKETIKNLLHIIEMLDTENILGVRDGK